MLCEAPTGEAFYCRTANMVGEVDQIFLKSQIRRGLPGGDWRSLI